MKRNNCIERPIKSRRNSVKVKMRAEPQMKQRKKRQFVKNAKRAEEEGSRQKNKRIAFSERNSNGQRRQVMNKKKRRRRTQKPNKSQMVYRS
jgi:hypothetical protein